MRALAPSSRISSGMFRFVSAPSRTDVYISHILRDMQNSLSRAQREGLRPSDCNAGHGRTQVRRILAYEEALCI